MGRFVFSSRGTGGWQAGTIQGGNPFGADISTVRCIKERSSATRRLYFLSFDATLPYLGDRKHAYSHLLLLKRDGGGHWGEARDPASGGWR
jgi:hypothetical protein